MDLIRLLLMRGAGYDVSNEFKRFTTEQCAFHTALLKDAGFVDAVIVPNPIGFPCKAETIRLTWQGFEFLELVKDPRLWAGSKKVFTKAAGWATPLLVEWLKSEAKRHLGLK